MRDLSLSDIKDSVQEKVFVQGYSKKKFIEGVKVSSIKIFRGEDGTFEEMARLNDNGNLDVFPNFKIKQISRSKLLPGAIKAWHLHFKQEDVWYISSENQMMLGLWDLRKGSPTEDLKMRIPLGGGMSKLVYIPRGVAHGVVNFSNKEGIVVYFVNSQFNLENPDENRLPWDIAGANFWQPQKG